MAGERILLVEDNAQNRRLAQFLLKSYGYLVDEAATGEEALDRARTQRPDLILMDLQLPGMDGFAVTRLLKQDRATMDIPVVALTAYAMLGDPRKALDAGCEGYITKPINISDFRAAVQRYLAAARAKRTGTPHGAASDDPDRG